MSEAFCDILWNLLILCQERDLIEFKYSPEVLRDKLRQCITVGSLNNDSFNTCAASPNMVTPRQCQDHASRVPGSEKLDITVSPPLATPLLLKGPDFSSENAALVTMATPTHSPNTRGPILLDASKVDTTIEETPKGGTVQVEEDSVDSSSGLRCTLFDDLSEGEIPGDACLEEESPTDAVTDETAAGELGGSKEAATIVEVASTESEDTNIAPDTQGTPKELDKFPRILDIPCTEEHRRRTIFDFSTPNFSPDSSSKEEEGEEGVAKLNDEIEVSGEAEDRRCNQIKPSKVHLDGSYVMEDGEREFNSYLGDDECDNYTHNNDQIDETHRVSSESEDAGQEDLAREINYSVDEEGVADRVESKDVTPKQAGPIIISSDESDTKLEELFSNLRLQSTKKLSVKQKIVSRKSLERFVVCDYEDDDCDSDKENKGGVPTTPCYSTPLLNDRPGLYTLSATKSVKRSRYKMVAELFNLFNESVFNNQLPADMEIEFNNRLRTTAGHCTLSGHFLLRKAKIDLSTKVCDTYDRIRDTLIHELCHAATWIIDGVRNAGHGPMWKKWAAKAREAHSNLTPITRCHGYDINYKYKYSCVQCNYKFGRHTKSVDLSKSRCPYCQSAIKLHS